MRHDLELQIQAWVDGELPEREARRIAQRVARDAEAAALAAELGCIRQALSRHKPSRALDESRQSYWGKIERRIRREAGVCRADSPLPWYEHWRKHMEPASAKKSPLVTPPCPPMTPPPTRSSAKTGAP